MTLALFSANDWTVIIAAVGVVVLQVVNMVLAFYRDRDKALRDAAAARAVAAVKTDLAGANATTAEKLDGIAAVGLEAQKTGESVHTLVNNIHGKALESNAILSRRLAEITGDSDDHAAADAAAKLYAEHQGKQARVDKGDAP